MLLWVLKPIVVLFNKKFATRENKWKIVFQENLAKIKAKGQNETFWIHSASMGEFEQAKPLIEIIKKKKPNAFVVATFFSPSGYENQKNYPFADVLLYLPFDFLWLAKMFVDTIKPNYAIFIKYEFWLNYLYELRKKNVPTFLVSATEPFRGNNFLYRMYLKHSLNFFNKVFVLDPKDLEFYKKLNLKVPIAIEYDTRFDRVFSQIRSAKSLLISKDELKGYFVLVAGSVWEQDLNLIFKAKKILGQNFEIKIIYVPHEPSDSIIELIEKNDPNTIRYSAIANLINEEEKRRVFKEKNIIVDRIGLLLSLYSLADIAYVGGGFGKGLHSVIEPAGYFLPIICGGNIHNSKDAINMKENGTLFVVNNETECAKVIIELKDSNYYNTIRKKAEAYFLKRVGATQRIINEILNTAN